MTFGSLLRPRKERLLMMLIEAVSVGVRGVPECEGGAFLGTALVGTCDGVGGRRSAGWRAGRGSERTAVWGCGCSCSWTPRTKPISPRFVGKGPACSLDSCVRVVEEVDAIAAVDAIIGSSGKSGEGETRGNVKENGIGLGRLVACTWQGLSGRQHQRKGMK